MQKASTMKRIILPALAFWVVLVFNNCIGDDILDDAVPESVMITNPIDTIGQGDAYQFEARFLNNVGIEENRPVKWTSSAPSLLSIDQNGLANGLTKGVAVITAEVALTGKPSVTDVIQVVIADNTSTNPNDNTRAGKLKATSSYTLTGDFTLEKQGSDLILTLAGNYKASSSLPGLYVYLSNNPNSIANALEIGPVTVFYGAHAYTIGGNIGLNDYAHLLYYCKPFNVKVGEGVFD